MLTEKLYQKSLSYLKRLCEDIPERCVGSEGNRLATSFFEKEISSLGWDTEVSEFDAIDWIGGGAVLQCEGLNFSALVSPYSLGCSAAGQLVSAACIEELESLDCDDKIVLLHGSIAREQLMPKNFVFYNPDEHKTIIALLEKNKPKAILSATGRNAALAGGVYPFPLIEDGDFNIPSVYMTEEEGKKLLDYVGKPVVLRSDSMRIPGKGCNVIARKGQNPFERFVITAHIDAKKGTPGALDNATGVIVLLLLAELLRDYTGSPMIEIVAFNGEDYFSAPGQMLYVGQNHDRFHEIVLNVNIDGAGYKEGPTAFSLFGLPEAIENKTNQLLDDFSDIVEGGHWVQGDHSIFIQKGRPAIAVTSKWFLDHIDKQDITHTPKDNNKIVDCLKIVEIAKAIKALII